MICLSTPRRLAGCVVGLGAHPSVEAVLSGRGRIGVVELHEYTPAGLHAFMASRLDAGRDSAVLDVGCGSGAWLIRLRQAGFSDLTGIDANPPSIPGITFLRADLECGELPTNRRFNLITCFEVYEHLENPMNLLRVISRYLVDGGFAIMTTPNIHALRYRLKFMLRGAMPSFDAKGEPSHITPLHLPRFTGMAENAGLAVSRIWTYPEHGTVMFGRPIRTFAAMVRPFVPDPWPGDSICIRLTKRG